MASIIPLQAVPNQSLQVQLGSQSCTIAIQQMAFGLFISLYLGGALIVSNVLCQNLNRIVRNLYFGFSGDLVFFDRQGSTDPVYTGLGGATARYQLFYLAPSDIPAGLEA